MNSEVSKQVALFDDSKRVVANLMARENITVQIVDGIPTASFNPVSRVLSIPSWSQMSVDQVDALMAHEIGHALFSDNSLYTRLEDLSKDTASKLGKLAKSKGFFTYVNVVEDARIERRMRESFPGLSRVFHNGYQQFHNDGPIFKGTQDSLINPRTGEAVKIASMKLIDRVNIYYKIGAFCHVPFSATERVWIDKIDRCGSMEQAIEIARLMYLAQREQDQQDQQDQQNPSNEQNPKNAPKSDEQNESDDESGDDAGNDASDDDSTDDSQDSDADESGSDRSTDGDDESEESDESGQSGDESDDDQDGDDEQSGGESGDESDEQDGDEQSGDESGDESDTDQDADGQAKAESKSDESEQSGAGDDAGDDEGADTVADAEAMLRDLASKANGERPQVRNLLLSPVDDATFAHRTVSAKAWTDMCFDKFEQTAGYAQVLDTLVTAWEARFLATAKSMSLEFERRKTAKALQHAKTGKTGKLDLAKLSQYRFSEDLFLRSTNVPNGKSHGVVMVIDASGSMSGCFASVLDQVLLFAHFAFQVNIPFEAYMFTDRSRSDYHYAQYEKHDAGLHSISLSDHGGLVGLVNTRTDRAGFKRQVRAVCALRHTFAHDVTVPDAAYDMFDSIPYQQLGGTPLFTGMMLGEKALANMKREARLDKTTFIVVTDGQDGNSLQYKVNHVGYHGQITEKFERIDATGVVVRDTVTKRTFTYVEQTKGYYSQETLVHMPTNGVLTMLLDVIKARHDARTIYLYLQAGGMSYGSSRWSRRFNPQDQQVEGQQYLVRAGQHGVKVDGAAALKSLKDDGQWVLPKEVAVADLAIILRQSRIAMDEQAFEKLDTSDMTQRKIAAEFTKTMVKNVSNRVFVNTVIPHLI